MVYLPDTTFGGMAQRIKQAIKPQPQGVQAYQLQPRAANFNCPTCLVGENNGRVADYFTPWKCWMCGDTEKTTPRPLTIPSEPAD